MATRRRDEQSLGEYSWLLTSGDQANQGEAAGLDSATGTVRPMGSSATQTFIGFFAETKTGDGTTKVRVRVSGELEGEWMANSATDPVAAADIGGNCFAEDARTVAASDGTGTLSKMGRVLDFDAGSNLVLVQTYPSV